MLRTMLEVGPQLARLTPVVDLVSGTLATAGGTADSHALAVLRSLAETADVPLFCGPASCTAVGRHIS